MTIATEKAEEDLNILIGESIYRMKEERIREIVSRIISSLKTDGSIRDAQRYTEGIKGSMSDFVIESRE